MKRKNILMGVLSVLTLLSTSISFAGNRPGATTLTLSGAYYHFSEKRATSNTYLPNAALAYNFDDHWAVEGLVGFANTNNNASRSVHMGLYTFDGVYRFTPRNRFEPYVLAGVGMIGLYPPANNEAQYQGNVNAGIGTQIFADDSIAFRADVRDLYTLNGGKQDIMANLGVSFLFGK